jgi:hypothetical protein
MMPSRHLSCRGCRIRVLANAPEIDLLEGSCPICGATLGAVPSAQDVMGFRWFDLDALSDGRVSGAPHPQALARRVEGSGSFPTAAVAGWPAPGRSPGAL